MQKHLNAWLSATTESRKSAILATLVELYPIDSIAESTTDNDLLYQLFKHKPSDAFIIRLINKEKLYAVKYILDRAHELNFKFMDYSDNINTLGTPEENSKMINYDAVMSWLYNNSHPNKKIVMLKFAFITASARCSYYKADYTKHITDLHSNMGIIYVYNLNTVKNYIAKITALQRLRAK